MCSEASVREASGHKREDCGKRLEDITRVLDHDSREQGPRDLRKQTSKQSHVSKANTT